MDFQEMSAAYQRATNNLAEETTNPYPTIIIETRYSGFCEGGRWASFPSTDYKNQLPPQAFGDGAECIAFWMSKSANKIGRGNNPNDAYEDMLHRLKELGTKNV